MCELAARAPARERPDLTTITGFVRVRRPAISRKRVGLPKLSTYIRITCTSGSASQASSRSLPLTSGLLPTDTNCEIPIPYSLA